MNKNEYLEKMASIREEKDRIDKEYIESNKQFEPGTKGTVTDRKGKFRIGVVKNSVISEMNNEVVPFVRMLTNDGIESLRRIVIYPEDTIEVITD